MSILSLTYNTSPRVARSDALLVTILSLWLAVALAASLSGVLASASPASVWAFPALIFGPIALFALAYRMLPAVQGWALGLDRRLLIGLHVMRTVGLGFIFLSFYDILPAAFAYPAGLGDAVAAVWALWLGFSLPRGVPVSHRATLRCNRFGIGDFLIAVGLGLPLRSAWLGGPLATCHLRTFPPALPPPSRVANPAPPPI
ncbi:hypothetical protein [Thiohalocapsa sp.]|uniref:hypothetical protein n=1 Tax=Thiohalocapsa sp. TaxID=2497641 RepID=UPI0025E831F9|nr:hypothetical protein [Thiohalocapsa sp.]